MHPRSVPAWIACAVLVPILVGSGRPGGAQGPVGDSKTAPPRVAVKLTPEIRRAEIEAHVRFLAADERKGRVTGTPEAEECAQYLAEALAIQGLAPAGDGGTFLQRVPLVRTRATALPEMRFTGKGSEAQALVFGRDFEFQRLPRAGQGLKLVIARAVADLPERADPTVALFVDASTSERRRWLEEAKLGDGREFGLLLVPGNEKPGQPRGFESLGGIARASTSKESASTVRVHGTALERLRSGAVRSIDIEPHVEREEIMGSNVVARIPGVGTPAAPALGEEALVVTAHYDHIDAGHSRGKPPGADVIWNGADDDASGVAAVLEIAGALAARKPPARTVLFVLVTGEEVGLLGTQEYLDHPVVPLEKTIANLNFEMIGRPDPKAGGAGHLWFTGYELTNLGPAFTAAKLAILPDPHPEQNFYERSDNIAFVRRGIIGQTLSSYNLHKDYHQPSDEADTLDYAHMEGATKAGLEAVALIASGELTPAWMPGHSAPAKRR